MQIRNVAPFLLASILVLMNACKPLRDPIAISNLKTTEADITGRFVPKTREAQINEVELVLDQLETFTKEKVSRAISSGEPARIDAAMAEWMSVRHQADVLRNLDPKANFQLFRELDMTPDQIRGMREGILDSDKGKLQEYKDLLTKESTRSNKLFDALRLNEQGSVKSSVVKEMRQILGEMGFKGQSILNPETTNAQFRELLASNKSAQGYLHDLPGLVDAVELREKGIITAERFSDRVKANLFHNGPDAGFWKTLKGVAFQDAAVTKQLFKESVFMDANGKLIYPGSKSVAGILHRMADRISQATRGGFLKIVYETRSFMGNNRALAELSLQNPMQTIDQLKWTFQDIQAAQEKALISERQAKVLIEQTRKAIARVETHAKLVRSRIGNVNQVARGLSDSKYVPERLEILTDKDGVKIIKNEKTNGKVHVPEEVLVSLLERRDSISAKLYEQITDARRIDTGLKAFETAHANVEAGGSVGDPMRPIAERSLATKNLIERSVVQNQERIRQQVAQRQAQRSAAADALSNRFNSQTRQSANNSAINTQQSRPLTIIDVQTIENISHQPSKRTVQRMRVTFGQQISADGELKAEFEKLERAARQHETIRDKIRSGGADFKTITSYKISLQTIERVRTDIINRVRSRAVRAR